MRLCVRSPLLHFRIAWGVPIHRGGVSAIHVEADRP